MEDFLAYVFRTTWLSLLYATDLRLPIQVVVCLHYFLVNVNYFDLGDQVLFAFEQLHHVLRFLALTVSDGPRFEPAVDLQVDLLRGCGLETVDEYLQIVSSLL